MGTKTLYLVYVNPQTNGQSNLDQMDTDYPPCEICNLPGHMPAHCLQGRDTLEYLMDKMAGTKIRSTENL